MISNALEWLKHRFSAVGNAASSFKKQRADYYAYLADIMEATQGRKTLRDIFEDDGHRYGKKPRGVLSQHWASVYQESGGDLATTFMGTVPEDDVVIIGAAQASGAGALETGFRDLSSTTKLIEEAKGIFRGTVMVGVIALLVVIATLYAIPHFTFPTLMKTFAQVPEEFWGPQALRLQSFSYFLQQNGLALLVTAFTLLYTMVWSLRNWHGGLRVYADRFFIWQVYRDFQGIRFLATLATLVKRRGNVSTQLRDAISAQTQGASPWLLSHLNEMLARIEEGVISHDTFDTGILDEDTFYYLSDMIINHGMDEGMQHARRRIESQAVKRVAAKAARIRWTLLILSVASMLAITGWHYAIIDEMRQAMQAFYAS